MFDNRYSNPDTNTTLSLVCWCDFPTRAGWALVDGSHYLGIPTAQLEAGHRLETNIHGGCLALIT